MYKYILKHKNFPVLLFDLNDDYELEDIGEIFDKKRLPFGAKYEGKEKPQFTQFKDWIEWRGLPRGRSDLANIELDMKVRNSTELCFGSYALNLTDHYWAHKTSENLKWEDYNFFQNNFKDVINFDINGIFEENRGVRVAPGLTVDGSLRKKWILQDNERYLVKSSRYDEKQEPFNEVIASKIMKHFCINHVEYGLVRNESNNMPLSICKCMVDIKKEFMPASYIRDTEEKKDRSIYERIIDICKNKGIADVKTRIDEMIAIDFIIGNTDRHLGNFGIIRDPDNLKWGQICPVFDSGNSLCHQTNDITDIERNFDTVCKWYEGSNHEKLKFIDYPEWYDSEKIKDVENIIYNVLNDNTDLKEGKKEALVQLVNLRIKEFEKIISNKKQG